MVISRRKFQMLRNCDTFLEQVIFLLCIVDEHKKNNFTKCEDQASQHPTINHLDVGSAG